MIKPVLFAFASVLSFTAIAAEPKEEVIKAAKALGEKGNYSWKTTVAVPDTAQFRPGPTEGKTEKGGATHLKLSLRDGATMEAVLQGDKAAFQNQEGEWQTSADAENSEGPGRFVGRMLRNFKTPATQAADLAGDSKELKKDADMYAGELSEESAVSLMRFRGRGDSGGPEVKGAKGSVKFWVKDGALSKYEYKVQGTMNFNGNDIEVDRTTTVEIKEVGSTKVEVPEGAKKKLS